LYMPGFCDLCFINAENCLAIWIFDWLRSCHWV
jgi:hypothetical protein